MKNNSTFILGIGPTKTGSSWLYAVLKNHPDVQMPPVKEINYFSLRGTIGENFGWWTRFFQKRAEKKVHLQAVKGRYRQHKKKVKEGKFNLEELKWDLKFFLGRTKESWYLKLFSDRVITGDISPRYFFIREEDIKLAARLVPDAKVIIGLRDPIERVWSNAKMLHMKQKGFKHADEVEERIFRDDFTFVFEEKWNDYVGRIEMWKKYFPLENIFIYFFEELQEDSIQLFKRICDFLELELNESRSHKRYFNKGIEASIPDKYMPQLIEQNLPLIKQMATYFDSDYPKMWLQKYQVMEKNYID